MSEPIQVTGGEWEVVPIRGGQAQGFFVVYYVIAAGDRCIADTEGADDLPFSVDEGNVRLLAAAANSYKKHCSDPVRAAEADLLGEALEALEACVSEWGKRDCFLLHKEREALVQARSVLANTKDRQP